MDGNIGSSTLLQKIDSLIDELQIIRREVADLLVKQSDTSVIGTQETATRSVEGNAPGITCVSSLEELYAHDFIKKSEQRDEATSEPIICETPDLQPEERATSCSISDELLKPHQVAKMTLQEVDDPKSVRENATDVLPSSLFEEPSESSSGSLDELFMPSSSDEFMDVSFEKKVAFDLLSNLTIADKYLFSNELFLGNQVELMEMLNDIERLSSWSQLESYLFDVRRFGRNEEAVTHLIAFIKEHTI